MTWRDSAPRPAAGVATILAGSLLLTACGGSTDPAPTATTPPTASATASATTSATGATPGRSGSSDPATAAAQKPVPPEDNPPGDIPDNLAFVRYDSPAAGFRFTHPEGWAETTRNGTVTFTDKLNGVTVTAAATPEPPTVASARASDLPLLHRTQAAYELRGVTAVSVTAGRGVRIVYRRNSAPDPVTGRQYRDEVERYEVSDGKHGVVMELFGPVGADNVDAYRTMIDSLRLS